MLFYCVMCLIRYLYVVVFYLLFRTPKRTDRRWTWFASKRPPLKLYHQKIPSIQKMLKKEHLGPLLKSTWSGVPDIWLDFDLSLYIKPVCCLAFLSDEYGFVWRDDHICIYMSIFIAETSFSTFYVQVRPGLNVLGRWMFMIPV